MILGIDPGTKETGFALIRGDYSIVQAGKLANNDLREHLKDIATTIISCAAEGMQSYGRAVGSEVFTTERQLGRFVQLLSERKVSTTVYYRPEYGKAITGTKKCSDSVLRTALMRRFGGYNKGEPLNILKGNSDKRSAFAVAVYHLDLKRSGR